jgi:hypothetical protein
MKCSVPTSNSSTLIYQSVWHSTPTEVICTGTCAHQKLTAASQLCLWSSPHELHTCRFPAKLTLLPTSTTGSNCLWESLPNCIVLPVISLLLSSPSMLFHGLAITKFQVVPFVYYMCMCYLEFCTIASIYKNKSESVLSSAPILLGWKPQFQVVFIFLSFHSTAT